MMRAEFWTSVATLLRPFLWPFLAGSTICAIVLAVLAYPAALAFVTSRRRLNEIIHKHPPHR
jgi:hypothetical protein